MADKAKQSPDPVDRTPSPNAERQAKEHSGPGVGEKSSRTVTSGKNATKSKPSSTGAVPAAKSGSVSVSLNRVQEEVLDSLRAHVSQKDYVQQLINVHLAAANPNATFIEEQDLPGNEREIARLTGKVPAGAKPVRPLVGKVGNEGENFVPGHVPPIVQGDDNKPGNERDNFTPGA